MFWQKKTIEDHLNETKKIKVHGMKFSIKRINTLDYCTGAKVLVSMYDTYKIGNTQNDEANMSKVKSHFIDVLLAGIVFPIFSRKSGEEGKIFVENLLTDWALANELYGEIMAFSYGKKNLKQLITQGKK